MSPEGGQKVFNAYVAALYTQSADGPLLVNNWVYHLIYPNSENISPLPKILSQNQPNTDQSQPSTPHIASNTILYPSISAAYQYPQGDSVLVASPPRSNGLKRTISQTSFPSEPHNTVVYLPRFNELATKKRLSVQWQAENKGLQHAPIWQVECVGKSRNIYFGLLPNTNHRSLVVNGNVYGKGSATAKQLAKEEAAREAFRALGWQL